MPSANNRRNRRHRKKLQQQKLEESNNLKSKEFKNNDLVYSALAVDNKQMIKSQGNNQSKLSVSYSFNCTICKGKICYDSQFGSFELLCGCKFGKVCIDAYIREYARCPSCHSRANHEEIFQSRGFNSYDDWVAYQRACCKAERCFGISERVELHSVGESRQNFGMNVTPYDADQGIETRRRINQEERDNIIQNVKTAKMVTEAVATCTASVANNIGASLWNLGSFLAPAIRQGTKKILTNYNVDEEKAEDIVDNAMGIAKDTVLITGSTLRGVQNVCAAVASSASSGLAQIYEKNNGFRPDELAPDVGEIAKNVVHTAWNMKALHPNSTLTKISRIKEPEHDFILQIRTPWHDFIDFFSL